MLDQKVIEGIKKMRQGGHSYREIATKYDVSLATVHVHTRGIAKVLSSPEKTRPDSYDSTEMVTSFTLTNEQKQKLFGVMVLMKCKTPGETIEKLMEHRNAVWVVYGRIKAMLDTTQSPKYLHELINKTITGAIERYPERIARATPEQLQYMRSQMVKSLAESTEIIINATEEILRRAFEGYV